MGGVRPARLCEPQRLGPVLHPNSVEFGPRAPGVGRRPSAQARRPLRSQEHSPFTVLRNSSSARPPRAAKASPSPRTAIPHGIALLALSPKPSQKQSPKHAPVFRPVSASLRLRCRSATFSVARWDFISILLTAKRVKSLFTRADDGVFVSGQVFSRAVLCPRALRDSSIFGSRRNS